MMEQRWVIDSIEENIASVEIDGHTMITVPVAILPTGTREGQILKVRSEGTRSATRALISFEYDAAATSAALARSAEQVKKGARQANDPGGNITF